VHLKLQAGGGLVRTDGGDASIVDGLEEAQLDAAALQPGAAPALRDGMARVGVDFNARHQATGKAQLAGHSVVVDLVLRRVRDVVGLDTVRDGGWGAHGAGISMLPAAGLRSLPHAVWRPMIIGRGCCLRHAPLRAASLCCVRDLRATVLPVPIH